MGEWVHNGVEAERATDAMLSKIAELVKKRNSTLELLTFLCNQDPTLEVFADALRLRLM